MNVFKLSLYFSHFFQMQMLRRFGIVTHCQKNCTATLRPGKTLKAMTSNNTGNHTRQYWAPYQTILGTIQGNTGHHTRQYQAPYKAILGTILDNTGHHTRQYWAPYNWVWGPSSYIYTFPVQDRYVLISKFGFGSYVSIPFRFLRGLLDSPHGLIFQKVSIIDAQYFQKHLTIVIL